MPAYRLPERSRQADRHLIHQNLLYIMLGDSAHIKFTAMKLAYILLLAFGLFGCNQQTEQTQLLQNRIDSLEKKLSDS